MPALPTGTVTFLFTDIEGSTRLLNELGDRYPEALGHHRRLLREAFARHDGAEVDTQGDAFFVAFADARGAVTAAAEAQAALAGGPIRVRMGLHTGEPIVWEEGYAGLDVHRGARICAAAHGGQIVLSERTRAEADGVFVRDLGMHRLKDLSEPQRLHQLGDGDFPPLRTLHATNLPTQATPLVGRERELAESTALLREHRLVTLTGPGGSGKTRLALQLAADTLEEFPDGVFWVSLQAVRDPALVLPAIAQTLGVKGRLVDHVADNRVLLLLDNLEQVIESAPALSGLLADTRNTKLLVTSREPLRIRGEQRYPVEPLPDSDAIRLFLERARAVDPDFEVSAAVAEICRRLDRLPLALELAAARVSLLVTDDLLARLEQALPVLTLGARDAPERQRTLEATIAWSYDLLSEPEQRLFRRLGAFAGSFDRGAIEAVCEAQIDTLQSLVDKSLVRRWGSGRLGMLETVHEFAIDRLAASGEADAVRWNHAQHYLAVAKEAHLSFLTEGEEHYELAVAELDNFRAALDWALAQREFSLGAELAVSLANLWVARDPFEGERRFGALLEAAGDELSPELAAHLLFEYGSLLFLEGEYERGLERQERSLAAYRELGDERGIAEVLARLSVGTVVRGNFDRTRALGHEALEMNRRLGRRRGEAMALYGLAQVEWETGDFDSAVELMRESGALAAELGFGWWESGAWYALCEWAVDRGDLTDAERHGRAALACARRIGERMHGVYLLALLAYVAAATGRTERAGVLWGAVEAEEARGRVGQWEEERETYAERVLAYSDDDFERGRAEGRELSFEGAFARALA